MLGSSPRVRREARGFRDYQTVPKICVVLETARYPRRGGSLGKTLSSLGTLGQHPSSPGSPWFPFLANHLGWT